MNKGDLTKAVLRAIAAAKKGDRAEDSYVEFKARFTNPEEAARQIAGMANAVHGEQLIVIVGVDQHGKVWGADNAELANWVPQVKKHFDGPMPRLTTNVNLPVDGKNVTAFCFLCSDFPYMVRKGDTGDVPWREGNRTRSATREELFTCFSEAEEAVSLPTVDVLSKHLRPEFDSNRKLSRLVLSVDLYVKTKGDTPLVFPRHDCRVSAIKRRRKVTFDDVWLVRSRTEGGEVPADVFLEKPGKLCLFAFANSPTSFSEGAVTIEISLLPVNALTPVKLEFRMEIDLPPEKAQGEPEERVRVIGHFAPPKVW